MEEFLGVVAQPELFLVPEGNVANYATQAVRILFKRVCEEDAASVFPLKELHTAGFDSEQIWSQIHMQNTPLMKYTKRCIKSILKDPDAVSICRSYPHRSKPQPVASSTQSTTYMRRPEHNITKTIVETDDTAPDERVGERNHQTTTRTKRSSTTGFFDWDEMEKEADMDDEQIATLAYDEEGSDEDSGEEELDVEGGSNIRYEDFFGAKEDIDEISETDVIQNESEEEDNNGDKDEKQVSDRHEDQSAHMGHKLTDATDATAFQKQTAQMKSAIADMEEAVLEAKPWLLKGEAHSQERPENSLLEAEVEFNRNLPPPPEITIESTADLEDVIKLRCREERWDDPARKLGNVVSIKSKATVAEVSQEKSTVGLGELYEQSYAKTALGVEQTDESKKDQDEIAAMFAILCGKVDALSNFHFTPKPKVAEAKVQPAVPAIAMEEAVPMAVSFANLQAPEQVFEKKNGRSGILRGDSEMNREDRKRKRRANKEARRKAREEQSRGDKHSAIVDQERKKLKGLISSNAITKGTDISGSTKKFTKSATFFSNLQESIQIEANKKIRLLTDKDSASNESASVSLKL